jgi:antitoxin component of MazEF toxin-antitoxin module
MTEEYAHGEAQHRMGMAKTVRRLIKFGTGLAVTIPKEYADNHKLAPGGQLEVAFNDILVMVPITRSGIQEEVIETLQEAGYPVTVAPNGETPNRGQAEPEAEAE